MTRKSLRLLLVLSLVSPSIAGALPGIQGAASRPLAQAGYSFNASKGMWADKDGNAISQDKILALFPQSEDVQKGVAEGRVSLSLSQPKGESVDVAIRT